MESVRKSHPSLKARPMTLETNRTDLSSTRFVADAHEELAPGQCRLHVEHFALTTNNITYGVFGDMLRYWDVFPASDSPAEWGRIPTWGFAEVVESKCDDVAIGERLFGFLPMSEETIITPKLVLHFQPHITEEELQKEIEAYDSDDDSFYF
jgi:hypothetical protein